ncbi:F-box/LRR-repeat protein At3g26922-like isoform X2 [Momordica charantia]|uniref:F-box/LRR-repeat protein At3g26922-like isoform X2 n=1 Tax=Momordica charantia TaxID=3673 RepID=A0A6J1BZ52_MOMCH|nr:F-box/LRR-repeat protein At3g26922-like isoform X2 [Momordica charantia]
MKRNGRTSSGSSKEKKRFDLSMDSISQLPNDILVFILSRLTLEEAARTSTLSHKWRFLWAYIPCLNFDAQKKLRDLQFADGNLESDRRQYARWVSQVINSYKGPNLETLIIRFNLDSRFQCDVDKWVQFAFQWNLKMFELNFSDCYDSGQYDPCFFPQLSNGPNEHFPRVMFSNSSSLTTLKLVSINVGGEVLECFLTNCLLLEVLCVEYSHSLVNLRVVGASLKLRQLDVYMCNYLESLEISAPNLESFKYVGPWLGMPMKNAPKLLETHFGSEFGLEIVDNCFLLSSYSSRLQKLVLDLEVDFMENQGRREWPLLANLRELELIVLAEGHSTLLGFTSLIEASPCLQKFSLKLDYNDMFEQRALGMVPKSPHQHLKVVELVGFVGKPIDLELVQYLYENAIALEEIVFDTRKPRYMGTIFENEQNPETRAGQKRASSLQSILFSGVKVTII